MLLFYLCVSECGSVYGIGGKRRGRWRNEEREGEESLDWECINVGQKGDRESGRGVEGG